MELFKTVLPVLSLVIGWFLNEIRQMIDMNRKTKASLNRALTYLLEIRFQIKAIESIVAYTISKDPSIEMVSHQLGAVLEELYFKNDEIHKKYEAAIDTISEVNPMLAFELISKNKLSESLKVFQELPEKMNIEFVQAGPAQNELKKLISPRFDQVILTLASRISFFTKLKVKKHLLEPISVPQELDDYFNKYFMQK